MDTRKEKRKRAKKPMLLGRLLTLLPIGCILFYPVYLAGLLDVEEENYSSPDLPEAFSGLRIAYVSDIHYGAFLKENRVRALVEKVNALEADLLILGGDYGETSQGALDFFALKPGFHAKYGVLGVLGNHDRTLPESNLEKIQAAMRENGVIPLVNDVWMLEREGKTLGIAGVDDFYNGSPDLEKVSRLCRNADFTIFAPHTPDLLPETYQVDGGPFYNLALCGHTHGGQVALFGYAIKSSSEYGNRYRSGWYRENGVDILVSNGVGTSMLPVRLGARPQIHLITLEGKKQ